MLGSIFLIIILCGSFINSFKEKIQINYNNILAKKETDDGITYKDSDGLLYYSKTNERCMKIEYAPGKYNIYILGKKSNPCYHYIDKIKMIKGMYIEVIKKRDKCKKFNTYYYDSIEGEELRQYIRKIENEFNASYYNFLYNAEKLFILEQKKKNHEKMVWQKEDDEYVKFLIRHTDDFLNDVFECKGGYKYDRD